MNKLLTAIVLALAAVSATAKETVTILYAWGPGDSVANYHRTLANEANKIQDKYTFVFDTKPGAGGAIAANHTLNTPNVILAHSTAFFIRPNFYPNESYDLNAFKEAMPECMAPLAVASTKYATWKEVPVDKPVTIGVSGLGVTTHLAATQLQKKFPNLNIIPFKSTNDSMLGMVSGQIDLHVGFISEAEQWSNENKASGRRANVLGISGTKSVNHYPTLVGEGFSQSFANMSVGHHLVLPAKVDDARAKEYYDILSKAAKAPAVLDAFAVDYCVPLSTPYTELQKFYKFHTDFWRQLGAGVKIN